MLKFVIDCLRQQGYQATLAYYQPYSISPQLSVPIHQIWARTPAVLHDQFHGVPCIGVGCWMPELEVSHYWKSKHWDKLIADHDMYLAVSGSSLAALGLVQYEVPFLAWIASDWQGDREHRVGKFPAFRRIWDRLIVAPLAKAIERKIILTGKVVALSGTTQRSLNDIAGRQAVNEVLFMPIDTSHFTPAIKSGQIPTLGFIGRFEDPRKHISLLLEALAEIAGKIPDIRLKLIGDELSAQSQQIVASLGLNNRVLVEPYVARSELPGKLSEIDIFVVPSFQEGLCIAALEAMSCAVPVVSTRCGGPENYIVDGENGLLCDHNPTAVSKAVVQLLLDPEKCKQLGACARQTVVERFSIAAQTERFNLLLARQIANLGEAASMSGKD